jgi:transcription initiation factor TFIIH subunit 4
MLEDLRQYGLIWQAQAGSRRFSPTRLATTLTSSSPPLPTTHTPGADGARGPSGPGGAAGAADAGFIVLETNYRVYAYTDSALQTAVLNLFVSLKARFPNLVVGQLTRESVKRALANGIGADQIIAYLSTHAHPQMRRNVSAARTRGCRARADARAQNPLIPVTVQDQIRLWELEKNRVKSEEGACLHLACACALLTGLQACSTKTSSRRATSSTCCNTRSSSTLSSGRARRSGSCSSAWTGTRA